MSDVQHEHHAVAIHWLLCWLRNTSVLKRDHIHPRPSQVRSILYPFFPVSRSLQEEQGCPEHDGLSVCSPRAIRILSRYDPSSPAMLQNVSEAMFPYATPRVRYWTREHTMDSHRALPA